MRGVGRSESGVALAIVVWFIAGMSLLVAGVVLSARTDVRFAQIHLGRAQAATAGDGAVNLLMADVLEGRFRGPAGMTLAEQRYTLGTVDVSVIAVPAEWLVDLNSASPALLAKAMRMSGAAGAAGAKGLAEAVVQWRDGAAGVAPQRFDSTEDLLSVPGMNRANWDDMRDYLGIPQGRAGLNRPGARAQRALTLLGQLAPAQRLGSDDLPAETIRGGRSGSNSYRVDALVTIGDTQWLRRRWVLLAESRSALPWRVLRTEPARIVGPAGARNG